MSLTITDRLASLSLEEKIALVAGVDLWHTAEIERLSIPALWLSDGPNGVRGTQFSGTTTSACFPCGSALGATFDPELVREVGAAIGREARRMGVHVLLGPTMNIVRLPIAGRNFECFSEDPFLSARLAAGYVRGVQSEGVAAVAKHFVANDSELDRYSASSEVDERSLREVYLAPFHAAVHEAGVWAVMSGYNRINGLHACEHAELLLGVLKGEWGFDGLVMSDWYGTTSTVAAANAGLDLEMPGPAQHFGPRLAEAVASGAVDLAAIDDKICRLLGLIDKIAAAEPPPDDGAAPAAVIRRAASSAIVLIENRDALLPLDPSRHRSIALIGPNAAKMQIHGGGSARVNAPYNVSPLAALRSRLGETVTIEHAPGCSIERSLPPLSAKSLGDEHGHPLEQPVRVEYFDNLDFAGEPVETATAPAFRFVWNAAPVPGLVRAGYSVRLSSWLAPRGGRTIDLGLAGVGRTRLLLDGEVVIDNTVDPVVAPVLFGRGVGQVTARTELDPDQVVSIVVEFQAPSPALSRAAVEISPLPPTELDNIESGWAGVTAGFAEPSPTDLLEEATALASRSDVAVVVVGTNEDWESEGFDRESMVLPAGQEELIAKVAAVNANTVVVVNVGSPVTMPWADEVGAILQCWLPGQEAGNALVDVLVGDINPSGRLPVTVPYRYEDSGAAPGYPPVAGRVIYHDGVNVGYRHFDAAGIAPHYAFGHGLSYTNFTYGELRIEAGPEGVVASVEVTNRGGCDGAEIVQFYVSDLESTLARPVRELKGIAKVHLAVAASAVARVVLGPDAFAFFDVATKAFTIEPGEFEIAVGGSSHDLHSSATVRIARDGALD
jgi:beta-glucosidase